MLSVFWAVLRRDLLLAFRQRGVLVHHLLFFVLVVALFPLGTGASPAILVTVSPALIWMSVLLAALLSLQRLFKPDYEDGTLEQYLLSPEPLALIALAKVLAYWLASGLIFVLASPLLVLLLGVPASAVPVIMASLLLGTPTLGLVGAIGTALTLSLPRAGLLLSLLIFPLYVPVLIFGAGAMRAAIEGLPAAGALYLLAALLMLGISTAPFAIAAALKISME
ncbi:heme exporter protein CcmB [Salinisphaera sp.]|uniref:heme exporter protein CcmB n=1 Tax=Salinisphaera sp. TaxID=1914330 RepID=UPI000C524A17|nr:heme exporter protein CcmB [Salinisphaera sp.]MBS62622.1 heme exporter protein CcmB [Salinisphaera sp.]